MNLILSEMLSVSVGDDRAWEGSVSRLSDEATSDDEREDARAHAHMYTHACTRRCTHIHAYAMFAVIDRKHTLI